MAGCSVSMKISCRVSPSLQGIVRVADHDRAARRPVELERNHRLARLHVSHERPLDHRHVDVEGPGARVAEAHAAVVDHAARLRNHAVAQHARARLLPAHHVVPVGDAGLDVDFRLAGRDGRARAIDGLGELRVVERDQAEDERAGEIRLAEVERDAVLGAPRIPAGLFQRPRRRAVHLGGGRLSRRLEHEAPVGCRRDTGQHFRDGRRRGLAGRSVAPASRAAVRTKGCANRERVVRSGGSKSSDERSPSSRAASTGRKKRGLSPGVGMPAWW